LARRVRSSLLAVILAAIGALPVFALPARVSAKAARPALPTIASADGQPLSVDALRGKIVLVNFWASWCGPCRKELPSLDRLAAKRSDLVVIAASVDADRDDGIRAFAGRYPHLRLGFSALPAVQRFGALGMPYSVVLDRNGHEKARVPHALAWDGPDGAALLFRAR
jgi:thiol-disulfide isomerase/thioredoxin